MSIVVLIGPSGSGKDTIGYKLADKGMPQLVSFTTREIRAGEVHGEDYYFIDDLNDINDNVVESTEYSGNTYGLLEKEVDNKLKNFEDVYFISDANGARQIMEFYPDDTIVFWLKIDIKTMRSRMIRRGDSEESIRNRIEFAKSTGEIEKPSIKGIIELDAKRSPEDLYRIVMYHIERRGFDEW